MVQVNNELAERSEAVKKIDELNLRVSIRDRMRDGANDCGDSCTI